MVRNAKVCVVIKALNEEEHIARSIESSLAAIKNVGGEVILADSGSTDRTTEIGSQYPILVVQLANPKERRLGIGPQLGFQFCTCEYVYILDGDMELLPGFLEVAIAEMEKDSLLAGVAGFVTDLGHGNFEFETRKEVQDGRVAGENNGLDMGGLYKTDIIKKVGYLSNRNLHLYEEREIGSRLRKLGYRLKRIETPSVLHQGETASSFQLMLRRWRSRYVDGAGEWIRSSITYGTLQYSFPLFIPRFIIVIGWTVLALGVVQGLLTARWDILILGFAYQALLFLGYLLKKRSVSKVVHGLLHLQFLGAGLLRGLFNKQIDPCTPINARVISDRRSEI